MLLFTAADVKIASELGVLEPLSAFGTPAAVPLLTTQFVGAVAVQTVGFVGLVPPAQIAV